MDRIRVLVAKPGLDDGSAQQYQIEKQARRDNSVVERSLERLKHAAEGDEHTMPFILDAVRAYATVGEICDALRQVFGSFAEITVL